MTEPVVIGGARLYLGRCQDVLHEVPVVDSIITDPPYGVEAHTQQRRVLGAGVTRMRKVANSALTFAALDDPTKTYVCWWAGNNCRRWMLAFCQTEAIAEWRVSMEAAGAKWRRAGIWVKPDGMPQLTGDRPGTGCEAIAISWFGEGRSSWNGGGAHGVWISPKSDPGFGHGGAPNEHETQKPLRLMTRLVEQFTNRGELVLDPFMGSGTTGVAALQMGREFIGIEQEPRYFEIACRRMDDSLRQPNLFPAEALGQMEQSALL